MKILEAFGIMFIITAVSIIAIIGACIGACVGAVIFPLNILGGRADFTEIISRELRIQPAFIYFFLEQVAGGDVNDHLGIANQDCFQDR